MTERYIAAIENEGQIPRVTVLSALLHGLGLSADRIFYPDAEQEDPELDQLIRLIQLCDVEDRKVVSARSGCAFGQENIVHWKLSPQNALSCQKILTLFRLFCCL